MQKLLGELGRDRAKRKREEVPERAPSKRQKSDDVKYVPFANNPFGEPTQKFRDPVTHRTYVEPKETDFDTRIQRQVAKHMLGQRPRPAIDTWPQNGIEFGLVHALFERYPPWRARRYELARYGPQWRELVRSRNWDRLEKLYVSLATERELVESGFQDESSAELNKAQQDFDIALREILVRSRPRDRKEQRKF